MNKYPKITVDLKKLHHNSKIVVEKCNNYGIKLASVTKSFCANPEIVKTILEGGVKYIADSRIQNLIKVKDIDVEKIYLRLPMMSEIAEVVKYADISLNSELVTIKALSQESLKQNKIHKVVLMVDLGDLREGVWPKRVLETVEEILKFKGIKLIGIGTNLTCYGGVIPDNKNLKKLSELAESIEKEYNITLELISGGNSSSMHLLEKNQMPNRINNLRLGESIILGTESSYGKIIDNTHQDVFTLEAQIIEIKEKPSLPIGEIGVDAFGNKPIFEDRGIRKRAILAVGKQDLYPEKLTPIDEKALILGASSDHLIIDITNSEKEYAIGDVMKFNLKYPAILQLFTSQYVFKELIK